MKSFRKDFGGKITIAPRVRVRSRADLARYYTPGVGNAARYAASHPGAIWDMSMKHNAVAVVSDGSAVLGLGNIGPEGAIPVMEGKALLFKVFANIDAFPIVLDTQNTEEIVNIVARISPVFGGINLEDISAPRCFEIADRLADMLSIPVVHDDQDGSAIATLAGLVNAFKVTKREIRKSTIVVVGAGAAGTAIAKLLGCYGVGDMRVVDREGIIYRGRKNLVSYKKELAKITNKKNMRGTLSDAFFGAHAIVGVSSAGIVKKSHIRSMEKEPIVFAMANPVPEIMPKDALRAGARIVATGRSDFPNQINNAIVFPGLFRGLLDHRIKRVTPKMKIRVAEAIASLVPMPRPARIVPSVFHKKVVPAIVKALRP